MISTPKTFIRKIMTKSKQLYDIGPDGKFTPEQEEEVKAMVLQGLKLSIKMYVNLGQPDSLEGIIDYATTAYEAEDCQDDGQAKLTANLNLVTEGLQFQMSILDKLNAKLSRMENQVCTVAQSSVQQPSTPPRPPAPAMRTGPRPPRPRSFQKRNLK